MPAQRHTGKPRCAACAAGDECRAAGKAIRNLMELDLKPRDIMTRAAFENSMVLITALGGSTNAACAPPRPAPPRPPDPRTSRHPVAS